MTDEQVLADTRHWIEKAVIGLNLCPFARSVYVKNQVRIVVSRARHLDAFLDDLDQELDLLVNTPAEEVDTTLLVHPTLFPDFFVFNDFMGVVDDVVEEHGLDGVIQVASFHPQFQFAGVEPDDISNATNRAPFPTLHLLREDSVARAVASDGGDADAIVERNIQTLRALGASGWQALLAKP
ncbi:MAG: peptidase [Burkholderiales bacterium RIFCSPLOWO2_12_67_14]|nr:MAG: peptidase [Burkholderiales bacterium RIFCSPLOWO2_02_FULL_67_64]OGB40212.1 MAG: peptidase [Burkholderiales bacterium RIFCSPLOWO2_12_67_14]OGB49882.1 MAG: peptidase [Burkholderiales bacterium RIFCSPHIGHO2_12_FULL_67_38]